MRAWSIQAGLCAVLLASQAMAQAPSAAPVSVAPVVERTVSQGATFVGTVTPARRAAIGSAVDGRVVEFPLREGMRVEAGGTLAQLLTDTISLELAAAEGELQLRRDELAELENGTRPEEVAQAKALMEAARAARTLAESNLTRTEQLMARGATTENALESARAAAADAREAYNERKAFHDLAVEGPRKERIAQARARVTIQEAVCEKLSDQRKKHTIISRFAGYLSAEHTEEGQWVSQGDLVAEVVALDEVDIRIQVLESQIPHVFKGAEVRVSIPSMPDKVYQGHVAQIVPQADLRARTFPVDVRVTNTIVNDVPELKSGMFAQATLATGPETLGLLVPKDAIVLGGRRPQVFVLNRKSPQDKTGTARAVPVDLGVASESLIQVLGALSAGDLVVTRGNERIRDGQPLRIVESLTSTADASTQ
jgi:RND family efflux transporter MFP subunit